MPHLPSLSLLLALGVTTTGLSLRSAEFPALQPLLAVPDQVVLREDFATPKPLAKGTYALRQGTRWTIEDGVLRGRPSTPEFQAKKKDHQGYEPRLSIPACPPEFIIQFDLRVAGGKSTAIVPFVEFGHHMARLHWANGGGATLVANGESVRLAAAPQFKLESGRWYRALGEVRGDEILIQFAGGPTLYGKHPTLAGKKDGFGVTGNQGGTVELDNVTVWSVKPEVSPHWEKSRASLPKPTAIALKTPAAKKAAK